MSTSTPFREWTLTGIGGVSGGLGDVAAGAMAFHLTASGHSIRDEHSLELFAVPVDRVQMVHNDRLVPTGRFRQGRPVWSSHRALVGTRMPRLINNFSLNFVGGGPSVGIPISFTVSTPLHESVSSDIWFIGQTRRATDFCGEGLIIELGEAFLGVGGAAMQVIVFDMSHNIFGGTESLVHRISEALTDYNNGGSITGVFQNLFLEGALAFVYGACTGVAFGATLYLGRFGGLTEQRCDPESGGSCTRSTSYDG